MSSPRDFANVRAVFRMDVGSVGILVPQRLISFYTLVIGSKYRVELCEGAHGLRAMLFQAEIQVPEGAPSRYSGVGSL